MSSQSPLDPTIPDFVQSDREDKYVQNALCLIESNYTDKVDQDNKNWKIQKLLDEGFKVSDPVGPRRISSKMLQQAIWRLVSRTKILDFSVHGTGRPPEIEMLVTAAINTVLDKGKFKQAMVSKDGAFFKQYLYGDAFTHVGTNPDEKGFPIKFNSISNNNVYVDTYATAMRGAGDGKNVTKCVVVFSYSWAEACRLYPDIKRKNAGPGKIPTDSSVFKDLEKTFTQEADNDSNDVTQVAHCYDISNKAYTIIVGKATTVIKNLKGDKYPFMKDGEPYIPVIQNICMPTAAGFYNAGIGAMLYDLAIVSRQLLNMELAHVEDSTYPITLVSVPQGESAKFFNKLARAHDLRAAGYKGMVAMEYDPLNPGASSVQAQSLLTNNLVNQWQLIYDTLTREIQRLGISLDEVDRGTNVTASQIIAEEESANAFVKQVMEYNASELQFTIELAIEMIKTFVSVDDDTPLNLTTEIQTELGSVRADGITLGMIADELKTHNYFVKVNSRSGAIPSNIFKQAQITRVLPLLQPGSPEQVQLIKEFARLNDQDIALEAVAAPQGGVSVQEDLEVQPPAETERVRVNPRSEGREAAI